jgi:hypothetical protein
MMLFSDLLALETAADWQVFGEIRERKNKS